MSLQAVFEEYAAALEIARRVRDAKWNDMVHAYVVDEDTVAMADILLREHAASETVSAAPEAK